MSDNDEPCLVPYLTVNDGLAAIDFYGRAFGAELYLKIMAEDDRHVVHAALGVFGTMIYLSDELPEYAAEVKAPLAVGTTTVALHVGRATPADVDATIARAATAGCTVTMPAMDAPWGMRYGRLLDPFGHAWTFGAPLHDDA